MRGLAVALAATAVVLGPGTPGVTAADTAAGPQHVVPGTVLAPRQVPAPDLLPDPDEGCTVPVAGSLPSCPGPGPRQPFVGCVLPVGPGAPRTVEPGCVPFDPSPESRVVPVVPLPGGDH